MSKTSAPTFSRRRRRNPPATTPAEQVLKPLAGTIREIEAAQKRFDTAGMKSRHDIGKVLIRDFDKIDTAKQHCITRRLEFWETLAERVGLHSRTLRHCMSFAEKYDETDVVQLIKQGVTWTHVVHLLSLRMEEEREALLQRIAEEGLTAAALHKEIMEKHGNRRSGSGKQKPLPKPPNTLKAGLKRAIEKVTGLNNQHEHALFCPDFDLGDEIENEPPDEITSETCVEVDQLIESYDHLAKIAPDIVGRLRQARKRIDLVFEERERTKEGTDADSPKDLRRIAPTAGVSTGGDRTGFSIAHFQDK